MTGPLKTVLLPALAGLLVGACDGSRPAGSGSAGSGPAAPGEVSAAAEPPLSPAADTLPQERVRLETVAEGLEHPWGMAWLPDGDLLITERPGRLRILRAGRLDPRPVPGVPAVAGVGADQVFASRQGGLLDVALHPRFSETGWVYFTYAHGTPEANGTRVARARFDGTALRDWQVIFTARPLKPGGQHFGSRLLWLPDGTLLVSIGDGGNPSLRLGGELIRRQAQDPASHLGKVVRLDAAGRPAADNPFRDDPAAAPEVWTLGHRNIQGMAYDPVRRRVWASEHGSRGGDELNLLVAGANHGWPEVSFSAEYDTGRPVARRTSAPGFTDPRRVWMETIAPSGLAVYSGDRPTSWRGDLFVGGLVGRSVRRLRLDAAGRVTGESVIPVGARVRDVRQGPDGFLYVLTDEPAARLLRLRHAGT